MPQLLLVPEEPAAARGLALDVAFVERGHGAVVDDVLAQLRPRDHVARAEQGAAYVSSGAGRAAQHRLLRPQRHLQHARRARGLRHLRAQRHPAHELHLTQ